MSGLLLPILLLGCTPDVTKLYATERVSALAVATGVPPNWKPDAAVAIAAPELALALRKVIRTALSADHPAIQLPLPLGIQATLTPQLEVKSVKIALTTDCAACFSVQIALEGQARWEAGPASGSVPISAAASAILAASIHNGNEVDVRPNRIESLTVDVPSLGNLRVNASGPVQEWLRQTIANKLPPIRVATLDKGALPVRDMRLSATPDRLAIEILSDVPGASPLRALPSPTSGVEVAMSESVISGIARRAAYQAGTLAMDVAADPRGLVVDGSAFTLELRLWRLVGRGWYRDYEVVGDIGVKADGRSKLTFEAKTAKETASSPGALLVDPLAALFESRILDAIVTAMDQSLPAQTQQNVAGVRLRAVATDARGLDDALHLYGTLDVDEGGTGPARR